MNKTEIIKQQGRLSHVKQWIKKAIHKNKKKYDKKDRNLNKVYPLLFMLVVVTLQIIFGFTWEILLAAFPPFSAYWVASVDEEFPIFTGSVSDCCNIEFSQLGFASTVNLIDTNGDLCPNNPYIIYFQGLEQLTFEIYINGNIAYQTIGYPSSVSCYEIHEYIVNSYGPENGIFTDPFYFKDGDVVEFIINVGFYNSPPVFPPPPPLICDDPKNPITQFSIYSSLEITSCGPLGCDECPEAYPLNPQTNQCEKTLNFTPRLTGGDTIPIVNGCRDSNSATAYNDGGLRLYDDISSYTFPIRANNSGPSGINFWFEDDNAIAIPILLGWTSSTNPGNLVPGVAQDKLGSSLWGGLRLRSFCKTNCESSGIIPGTADQHGRLCNAGIWRGDFSSDPCSDFNDDTFVNFEWCIDINQTKQYLIGISVDNTATLNIINTVTLEEKLIEVVGVGATNGNYFFFHVFPITLAAGSYRIFLDGYNVDRITSFAVEIYDITLSDFQTNLTTPGTTSNLSATPSEADCGNVYLDLEPYILFSTQDYIGVEIPEDWNDPEIKWICFGEELEDEVCGPVPGCVRVLSSEYTPCEEPPTQKPCPPDCTKEDFRQVDVVKHGYIATACEKKLPRYGEYGNTYQRDCNEKLYYKISPSGTYFWSTDPVGAVVFPDMKIAELIIKSFPHLNITIEIV